MPGVWDESLGSFDMIARPALIYSSMLLNIITLIAPGCWFLWDQSGSSLGFAGTLEHVIGVLAVFLGCANVVLLRIADVRKGRVQEIAISLGVVCCSMVVVMALFLSGMLEGALLVVLGATAGLTIWSFMHARPTPKQAGVCPTCGYDLTGLKEGAVCPECGKPK